MEGSRSGQFIDRIYGEFMAYKASVLSLNNADIFGKCYEIDIFVNLYEILMEKAEKLPDESLAALLSRRNILQELYDEWMKRDDSNYEEIVNLVSDEIEAITDRYRSEGRAA